MNKISKEKIINIVLVSVTFLSALFYELNAIRYTKHFFATSIHSKVVKSNGWTGRSLEFIFEDNNSVDIVNPINDKMMIGDSISKSANTNVFCVYRKNENGYYYFFKEYGEPGSY